MRSIQEDNNDMPYSVNIKDIRNIFSQNVLYNTRNDFMQKIVNQKMTLAGFSQRGSQMYINTDE